jgi:hypothetical protein
MICRDDFKNWRVAVGNDKFLNLRYKFNKFLKKDGIIHTAFKRRSGGLELF